MYLSKAEKENKMNNQQSIISYRITMNQPPAYAIRDTQYETKQTQFQPATSNQRLTTINMQNKPNFQKLTCLKAPTKQANGGDFTTNFLHFFLLFPFYFSSLFPTFMQNELKSMYIKGLQKCSPRHTLHPSRDAR
jgi:hypothetical protein